MKAIILSFASLLALTVPAVSQTATNVPSANIDLSKPIIASTQARRIACRANPANRACANGARPEQRQVQQRRTRGVGGGPRP